MTRTDTDVQVERGAGGVVVGGALVVAAVLDVGVVGAELTAALVLGGTVGVLTAVVGGTDTLVAA
jgi:hypothetical protein